jgi:hypothetical protein
MASRCYFRLCLRSGRDEGKPDFRRAAFTFVPVTQFLTTLNDAAIGV